MLRKPLFGLAKCQLPRTLCKIEWTFIVDKKIEIVIIDLMSMMLKVARIFICFSISVFFIVLIYLLLAPYHYYEPNLYDFIFLILICAIYIAIILIFAFWNRIKSKLVCLLIVSILSILIIEPYQRNLDTRGSIFIAIPIGFTGKIRIIEDRNNFQFSHARALENFGDFIYELREGENEIRVRRIRIFYNLPIIVANDGFFPSWHMTWESEIEINIVVGNIGDNIP